MIKRPIKHAIVEQMHRLGDADLHQVGEPHERLAQTYHYHNTLEVIIILQGWVEGLVGGIAGIMRRGMVAAIGNDLPHCVLRASADCKAIVVHIPSELLKWDEERFPELAHGIDFLRNSKNGIIFTDSAFASRLAQLAKKINSATGFLRMSLLMRMLHILSTSTPTKILRAEQQVNNSKNSSLSSIERAYSYLYDHFREDFSLTDIASHSGQNPSSLCRAFKRVSGCTIMQFCSRLRIEYACNLLLTSNLGIAQIAYQSGYNSYPYFCSQFKSAMNMSPSEYRRKSPAITPHN